MFTVIPFSSEVIVIYVAVEIKRPFGAKNDRWKAEQFLSLPFLT